MKKSLFIVLLAVQLSNAQNAKIDSLKSLSLQKTGIEKIDLLNALALELIDLDNEASLRFAKESLKMATPIGDSMRIVTSGRILSGALRRLERLDSAIKIGSYCEKIAYRNNFNYEREGILKTALEYAICFQLNMTRHLFTYSNL